AERQRLSRHPFHIVRCRKRQMRFRRSVAAHTIKTKSGIEDRKRRGVTVGLNPLPDLRPIPTVGRSVAIANHHRPVVMIEKVLMELRLAAAVVLSLRRCNELLVASPCS